MNAVRTYLEMWLKMIPAKGRKTVPGFLLEHGKEFPVPAKGIGGKRHRCFGNAAEDAIFNGHTYVEGYITTAGVPIAHAWTLDKDTGEVREVTLKGKLTRIGDYFGVPITRKVLMETLLRTKSYGLLTGGIDPWEIKKLIEADPAETVLKT